MASKSTNNATRILISLIFLVTGAEAVWGLIQAFLNSFEIAVILGGASGILMFITGIFGLMKSKAKVCRVLGIIICILNAAVFIQGLLALNFATSALTTAILAWVYFDCT